MEHITSINDSGSCMCTTRGEYSPLEIIYENPEGNNIFYNCSITLSETKKLVCTVIKQAQQANSNFRSLGFIVTDVLQSKVCSAVPWIINV